MPTLHQITVMQPLKPDGALNTIFNEVKSNVDCGELKYSAKVFQKIQPMSHRLLAARTSTK